MDGHLIRTFWSAWSPPAIKERFVLGSDGSKICANYGHLIDVDLGLPPTLPPEHLFHGTAWNTRPAVRDEGLQPQSRQHAHLSSTREAANRVGSRHGTPVVLTVDAQTLHNVGLTLYRSSGAVWLTDRVPPGFLNVPNSD